VIRAAEGVGRKQRVRRRLRLGARLAGIDDRVVVVEGGGLVGVDVPFGGARRLRGQRGAREGMVEAAGLSVEDEAVGAGADEPMHEVLVVVGGSRDVVGAGLDRAHRILEAVAVQIADDQDVGVAASGRIRREPVDESLGTARPRPIAAPLSIALIAIPDVVAGRALRLQMDEGERELLSGRVCDERLREDRAIARVEKARIDLRIEDPEGTDRRHGRRSKQQADPDGVTSDRPRRERRMRPASRDGIGRVGERLRRNGGGVLELHHRDSIGIEGTDRRHELRRLARELGGGVGAATIEVAFGAADAAAVRGRGVDRREVVREVEARDAERAADVGGRERSRRARREVVVLRLDDRPQSPEIVRPEPRRPAIEDAGQVRDPVAEAEAIRERESRRRMEERTAVGEGAVAAIVAIVEDHAAAQDFDAVGDERARARKLALGRRLDPSAGLQDEASRAAEVVGVGEGQEVRETDPHRLEPLGHRIDRRPRRRLVVRR
jgi:hypothetical protein